MNDEKITIACLSCGHEFQARAWETWHGDICANCHTQHLYERHEKLLVDGIEQNDHPTVTREKQRCLDIWRVAIGERS